MKLLKALEAIGLATIYNFQPFTTRTAVSLKGSLLAPTKQIKRLVKKDLIRAVPHYPPFGRSYRNDTFYTPKDSKHKQIAHREIEHQSALADVLMAFIYLFPDFDVQITYLPTYHHKGRSYRPDALVKLTDKDMKEYTFIIELERSRDPSAIYKEKLIKNRDMSLKDMGLPPATKYLYIYAYERFNVFWRPMEYSEPKPYATIKSQEKRFKSLIEHAKDLPQDRFRFLPLHKFIELDQIVWTTPWGDRVKLIT